MMYINYAINISVIKSSMMAASTTTLSQFISATVIDCNGFCSNVLSPYYVIVSNFLNYWQWLCSIILLGCLYYVKQRSHRMICGVLNKVALCFLPVFALHAYRYLPQSMFTCSKQLVQSQLYKKNRNFTFVCTCSLREKCPNTEY